MRRATHKNHNADYGRIHMYSTYCKRVSVTDRQSEKVYRKVLNDFNKAVVDLIVNEAYDFIIPCNLGSLKIIKFKNKFKFNSNGEMIKGKLYPNWKATNELWAKNPEAKAQKKLIYHVNEHSEGYQHKWCYDNYRNKSINKTAYNFIAVRSNKRRIPMALHDENFKGDFYSQK